MSSRCSSSRKAKVSVRSRRGRVVLGDAETGAVRQRDRRRLAGALLARRLEGDGVEGAEAHADQEPRRAAAQAGDHLAQEARAVLEVPAEPAGAVAAAQQLVAEVAVAVLDVHELVAGLLREHARGDEALYQRLDLLVGGQGVVVGDAEALVEYGMARRDPRLGASLVRGLAEPPGVGELQADQQVVGGAVALPVLVDQRAAQAGQIVDGVLADAELVGVGAAGVLDGHRLASPDQLGAAPAEGAPAPLDQVRGPPVGGAVPSLHGLHAEAVAHGAAVRKGQRLRQRPGGIALGEGKLFGDAELVQVLGELLCGLQRCDATIRRCHTATLTRIGGPPQRQYRQLRALRCVRHPWRGRR